MFIRFFLTVISDFQGNILSILQLEKFPQLQNIVSKLHKTARNKKFKNIL